MRVEGEGVRVRVWVRVRVRVRVRVWVRVRVRGGLGSGSRCIHTSLCLGRGGGLPRWLLHASLAPLPLLPLGMPLLLPRLEVARRAG